MTRNINDLKFIRKPSKLFLAVVFFYMLSLSTAEAASLFLSPSTGVYSSNGTFVVKVMVNTEGKPVNAADGTLSFNPNELSVVSANRTGSIFNLWVTEPTFSNSAGTINFSGGLPSGYTGSAGNIMTVTFRSAGAGTARVKFSGGSVLANDGMGTNILTAMNGGTYTIQAKANAPEPEVIEYIAPANTPKAPEITSSSHTDPNSWYKNAKAELSWSVPPGVIAVRTLLDSNPTSIPTKVYDTPINNLTLDDLPEGESYFHIQFKNAEGWGKVTHYRLAVDTVKPGSIEISIADNGDPYSPNQSLLVKVLDETSVVKRYQIKIDNEESFEYIDNVGSSTISLPTLAPGYHAIIIEAFDQAGNGIIGTHSLTLEAFEKPVFTDYPSEINEEVIPVIKGITRPDSTVEVFVEKIGSSATTYQVLSDSNGQFIFIPEGTLSLGVYEISAEATDKFGAKSSISDTVRVAVQQPGYLRIGTLLVSVLSVIIPLVILTVFLVLGVWYLVLYSRKFRRKVGVESLEAHQILLKEFTNLQTMLRSQESLMQASRKTNKLTKAESDMIQIMDKALQTSQKNVEKEISDITELAKRNK